MTAPDRRPPRVGGQALADGVLMRSGRAWAIARGDGSVEVGAVPVPPAARLPVVRVVAGLGWGLKVAIGRGMLRRGEGGARTATAASRRANRRFLLALAGAEMTAVALASALDSRPLPVWAEAVAVAAPWVVTLGLLRLATPASLWRFHGAEHKAVAAHEAGVDLADVDAVLGCSRVHDRCGTNLVFVMMVAGLFVQPLPALLQVPAFLVLMGVTAEVISVAAARPRAPASRLLLAGGRALQRWVTTAEPSAVEQAVACRALLVCLEQDARLDRRRLPPGLLVAAA